MNRGALPTSRRFRLAWLLAALALAQPARAEAGVVVLLQSGPLAPYTAAAQGFLNAYPPGAAGFSIEDAGPDALQRRIEALHPEVIVTVGLKATLFARDRFPRVPRVFCVVQNWERLELGDTWTTGVSTDVSPEAELRALHAEVPEIRRVGLLYSPAGGLERVRRARAAARAEGMTLVEAPVGDLKDLPGQARDLAAHADALWMPADPLVATPESFHYLLRQSLDYRKPLLVFSESLVRIGALLAVSPDYAWVGTRVAEAVRRIQAGERAGDIPVCPLDHTRLVFNPATSRALGLAVPAGSGAVEVRP